jgi:hypothetical protein
VISPQANDRRLAVWNHALGKEGMAYKALT